jgi:putative copper export protein
MLAKCNIETRGWETGMRKSAIIIAAVAMVAVTGVTVPAAAAQQPVLSGSPRAAEAVDV